MIQWILALCTTVSAFNVYQDIYSKPVWDVALGDVITETEATALVHDSKYTYNSMGSNVMMALQDHQYLCHIPVPAQSNETESSTKSTDLVQAKSSALKLLEPLKDTCLHYASGYWMYEICYNKQVKQFHPELRLGKAPKPQSGTPQFTLGRYAEGDAQSSSSSSSSPVPAQSIQNNGDVNYLKQTWTDGTKCDLTGEPRTIEVRYFCRQEIEDDTIAWVREVKTCHYVMVINTPKLCSEVAFLPPRDQVANEITCRRVVNPATLSSSPVVIDYEKSSVTITDDSIDIDTALEAMLDELLSSAQDASFVFSGQRFSLDEDFTYELDLYNCEEGSKIQVAMDAGQLVVHIPEEPMASDV